MPSFILVSTLNTFELSLNFLPMKSLEYDGFTVEVNTSSVMLWCLTKVGSPLLALMQHPMQPQITFFGQ